MKIFPLWGAVVFLVLLFSGCTSKEPVGRQYLAETIRYRSMVDSVFRYDPQSPFRQDTSVQYHGLNWYPPDSEFYFRSKLHRYANPEHVSIFGTKGEERKMIRYGYFLIDFQGKQYVMNIYKTLQPDQVHPVQNSEPLSVWFTDETTGNETYGVGRYIDVGEEQPDPDFIYTINCNNAYNPYCAYSARYSCAIPRKEDHLPFPVHAGEKKYHL
jgi:uncharacterized protein (DUF1684 family)